MTTAHINRIATGVPSHDAHSLFVSYARALFEEPRARSVFDRLAVKSQIEHRFSVLPPPGDGDGEGASIDASRVYARGHFPSTAQRMQLFEEHAPTLAVQTVAKLDLGADASRITHVVVTSCTGMYAPGLDLDLVERTSRRPLGLFTMLRFAKADVAARVAAE